jgi:hypothetical protein
LSLGSRIKLRWYQICGLPEDACDAKSGHRQLDTGDFEDQSGDYFLDDEIRDTPIALLSQIAIAFVPETVAAAACINN